MKRRKLLALAGTGLITSAMPKAVRAATIASQTWDRADAAQKAEDSLAMQWLGHTCFLFTGGGVRILVNPFRMLGCTAKYRSPKVAADLVLISSQLLDEGATEDLPGSPRLIYESGVYQFNNIKFQGITTEHDRVGGKQFGNNVAWRWTQAGINILSLGGTAAPITVEQKILMQRPDVLLVPVGGGPKAYNAQEAKQTIEVLNPKLIVPTQYRTQAANAAACDLVPVDEFLTLMNGLPVRRSNTDTINLTAADLPSTGSAIQILSYKF